MTLSFGCGLVAVLIFRGIGGIQQWETTKTVGFIAVLVNFLLSLSALWYFVLSLFEVTQLDAGGNSLKFWHVGTWTKPVSEPACRLRVRLFRLFNEARPMEPAELSVWTERPFLAVVPISRLAAG
jgi:hypothetical protein